LGNYTTTLQYTDFTAIDSLAIYDDYESLYNWNLFCLGCNSSVPYALKYDYKCYLCSIITNCQQCSYVFDNGTDVSAMITAAKNPAVFSNTTLIQMRCLTCSSGYLPTLIWPSNLFTQCQSCSNLISNCISCSYVMMNSILTFYPTSWTFMSVSLKNILLVGCSSCQTHYGIADVNSGSCSSCPLNCEYCYLNSSSLFCGRCVAGYVLSIYQGVCQNLSLYNIDPNYLNACSQIVSVNPWSSLLINSSQYLCQNCKNSLAFPSITGNCTTCSSIYCSQCQEWQNNLAYTTLLTTQPISLIDDISNTTNPNAIQTCLSCSNPTYGFQAKPGNCCPPQQTVSNPLMSVTKILYCQACNNQCQTQQTNYFCNSCKTCTSLDQSELNNDTFIQNANVSTEYFVKRIYYILKNNYSQISTSPVLNDTTTYTAIYAALTSQQRTDLAASSLNSCTSCLITGSDCITPQNFQYQLVESAYSSTTGSDFTSQLAYQLYNSECLNGFVYDSQIQRCKFCPNNWTSCDAYKQIEFKYETNVNPQNTDTSIIQSLDQFLIELEVLENNWAFSYILNEFATKSLEILLDLDPNKETLLNYESFNFAISSVLKTRITSLQNYTFVFQPTGYDSDPTLIANVSWALSWSFDGYTHVIFRNIRFKIVPYYITSNMNSTPWESTYTLYQQFVPGIYAENCILIIESCYFVTSSQPQYYLLFTSLNQGNQNQAEQNDYIYGPLDLFSIFVQKMNNFTITNVTVTLSFLVPEYIIDSFLPFQNDIYFMNVGSFYINITELHFIDCEITLLIMIEVSLDKSVLNITNSTVEGCFMNSSNFFLSTSSNSEYYLSNLILENSTFVQTSFFDVDNAEYVEFSNITAIESIFEGSINTTQQTGSIDNLIISNNFVGKTINVMNCSFSYYLFSTITRTTALTNNIFSYNDFYIYNSTFFAFNAMTLFLSITLSSTGDPSNVMSFNNITFNQCDFQTTAYDFNVAIFMSLYSASKAILSNITIIDCYNVSGIYGDNFNTFEISNFNFSNTITPSYSQIPLNLLESFETYIINCTFLNLYTNFGVISIENVIWSPSTIQGVCLLENVFMENISIIAVDVQQISSIIISSKVALNIQIINSSFNNLYIKDSTFYQLSPCGVLVDSIESNMTINSSQFRNMTSTSTMNGFYLVVQELIVSNSSFIYGNFFVHDSSHVVSHGSFINIQTLNMVLSNSNFSYAFAIFGGVVYITTIKGASITVEYCLFNQVYAWSSGAAFYLVTNVATSTTVNFTNNVFDQLCSFDQGAVFFMTNSLSSPTSLSMNNNNISRFNAQTGGLIYASSLNISFSFLRISMNYDAVGDESFQLITKSYPGFNYVGALLVLTSANISFYSCKFSNLMSSTDASEILVGTSVIFNDSFSIYTNITFWISCFALTSSSINLNSSSYSNISSIRTSDWTTVITYPVFYLISDNYMNAFNLSVGFVDSSTNTGGGGFISSISSTFNISNSSFSVLFGYQGGVIYASGNQIVNSVIMNSSISNSYFNSCQSEFDGGALFLENTNVSIANCQFNFNTAKNGNGGAIYYWCPTIISGLNILTSVFNNNSAYIGGGIYYQNVLINIDDSTTFINNYAPYYGISKYSYPRKLRIRNQTSAYYDDTNFSISNMRTGADLTELILQILDEDGTPLVALTGQPSITITMEILLNYNGSAESTKIYSISDGKTISGIQLDSQGLITIQPMVFIAPPGEAYLKINSSSIMLPDSNGLFQDNIYNFTFVINVRNCIIGELNEIATLGVCSPCINGVYSYDMNLSSCLSCIDGLNCTSTTGETIVYPYYWRRDYYSTVVLSCDNLPSNCVGGNTESDGLCYPGHIGPRCEACDLTGSYWNKSYARSSSYQCVDCDTVNYNYVFLAGISIFSFVSMVISITGTVSKIKYVMQMAFIKKISRYSMLSSVEETSAIYIKIYLTYVQIIQVISQLDLPIPNTVKSIPSTVGNPTASALYSTDCFIALFKLNLPSLYVKLLISLIVPFIYLGLFTVGYVLFTWKKVNPRKYSFLCTVCLFTMIYFQPSIVQALMDVMACINIGGFDYIKGDVSNDCFTRDYYLYSFVIGIPAMILWGIFAPGIVLWRMFVNRNRLDRVKYQIRYGYLCGEYRIFFWEFIKMFEKILITLFLEFYETEIVIKGLLVLLIIAIYYSLLIKFQPYKKQYINKMDKISTTVCFLSIFLGVLAYNNDFNYMINMCYIAIIIINIFFNLFILRKIIHSYTNQIEDELQELSDKLHKIKFFSKIFKPKKIYESLENWRKVRRATARYLRERERKMIRDKEEERMKKQGNLKYLLSFEDYDPSKVGVFKKKGSKVIDKVKEDQSSEARRESDTNSLKESQSPENANLIYEDSYNIMKK